MADHDTSRKDEFLKTGRTLYRLIIAATLLSSLFSLTAEMPEKEEKWKRSLRSLIGKYQEYVTWLHDEVSETEGYDVDVIMNHDLWDGSTDQTGLELGSVADVGRFIENSRLMFYCISADNIRDMTLDANELRQESTILIADEIRFFATGNAAQFIKAVHEFISNNEPIDNEHYSFYLSPLEINTCSLDSTYQAFRVGFAPNPRAEEYIPDEVLFTMPDNMESKALVTLKRRDEGGKSFSDWLASNEHEGFQIEDDEIKLVPELNKEDRAIDIGDLERNLSLRIAKLAFQHDSISILGNRIPGGMLVYAIPLMIVVLLYHFLGQVVHLRRVLGETCEERMFAWLPLIPRASSAAPRTCRRIYDVKKIFPSNWGKIDALIHLVIFPIVPGIVIISRFHMWWTGVGWLVKASCVASLMLGVASYCCIIVIRNDFLSEE